MSKITTGFKCDPDLKANLEYYAQEYGHTTSSFIEYICAEHIHALENGEQIQPELRNDDNVVAPNVYEAMLAPFFDLYLGQAFNMKLPDGREVQRQVDHPIDVLEIILSSVKIKP